jgi:hydrogenase expression/formation protein HypC
MCLGIPGRVVSRVEGFGDQLVLVDVMGAQRQINIGMLEDADQAALAIGDWVLIHMGFVVELVDEAGAEKAMAGLELMGRPRDLRERRLIRVSGVVQGSASVRSSM